jgi:hypothetical protein
MNKHPKLTIILTLVGGLTLANASIGQSFAYTASSEKTMYGHFTVIAKDEFGNIKDYQEFDNVITDEGEACLGNLAFSASGASCSGGVIDTLAIADCSADSTCAAVVDSTTTFDDSSNANCGDNAKVGATSTYTAVSGANKVRLSATYATTDSGLSDPFTAREAGILNSAGASCAAGDQLFAIKVFSSAVTIAGSDTLTVNYDIAFSG